MSWQIASKEYVGRQMTRSGQHPPQADNRYRVHRSVKCYLANLACGTAGCTWYFSGSVERVVYRFAGRVEKVQYKNNFYTLQAAQRMKELLTEQLALGGVVHIGAFYVSSQASQDFTPYPFIDISSAKDRESYQRFLGR